MIPLDRGIEFYLSTLETEGKSPAYIEWFDRRLGYFPASMDETGLCLWSGSKIWSQPQTISN